MPIRLRIAMLGFFAWVLIGCNASPWQSATFPLKYAAHARFSHAGDQVAYELGCSEKQGIWIANADGLQARQIQQESLINSPLPCPTPRSTVTPSASGWLVPEIAPTLSPDYQRRETYLKPFWSPDDTKVAYGRLIDSRYVPGETIYDETRLDCVSQGDKRLCVGTEIYDLKTNEHLSLDMVTGASFAPDSQRVALFRHCMYWYTEDRKCVKLSPQSATAQLLGDAYGLQVLDLRSRQVIFSDPEATIKKEDQRNFTGEAYRWSPDGKSLCYPIYIDPSQGDPSYDGKLRIVQLNSPDKHIELDGTRCVWSPDSSRVAYTIYRFSRVIDDPFMPGSRRLYHEEIGVYDLASGEERVAFSQEASTQNWSANLEWSPNGKYLAFEFLPFRERLDQVPRVISLVDIATGEYQPIDFPEGISGLDWLEWSPDSKQIRLKPGDWDISHLQRYYTLQVQ